MLFRSRYPDTDSTALMTSIAAAYGLKKENVVCGVGSDELIDCISSSTLEPGEKVLMPDPSFSMYAQFTQLNDGELIRVPLTEEFGYDVAALERVIMRMQPKVILLCNPNNPTGSILQRAEIERLLKCAKGLVVVDEAYGEFTQQAISAIPLINDYSNLIVLKTFSKAYALAGTRVGYALAGKGLIDLINTVKPPYNLNMLSQVAATWAMAHREHFLEQAQKMQKNREALVTGLQALGLAPYPSEANFVWLKLPEGTFEALKVQQIYIRQMKAFGEVYHRISVGTTKEQEILLDALSELVRQ